MKKRFFSIILCFAMLIASCSTTWTISSAKSKPVKLNASKKSLKVGKKYQLKVKKAKGITLKNMTFTKKGAAISITKKGKVTAKKPGKATVSCKVKYQEKGKKKIYQKTLKCIITVLAGEKTETPAPENSVAPENTNSPTNTKEPDATISPDATVTPDVTAVPTGTPTVQNTVEPVKTPTPTQPSVEHSSSFELIKDMGVGINLGNTLEACGTWINGSSVSNYETAWQVEKNLITADMIQGMRKAGFKTLRIPVAWSNMMSTDGTYTINEAYFNRVDQIVGYTLDAGMYPIVNIHYDSGWWARFGSKDGTERQEAMKKYKTMWTQLADHYKNYSNMLIFESANEELGTRLNSTGDYVNSGYYTSDNDLYRLTNEINQTFVDIVRASGGKNADRYLLLAGYDTDIDKTCDSRFKMPTDTITDHLMVSVHYYSPSTYCIVDDPDNSWGYRNSWGTDTDIKEMQASLSKLKIRFTNQGIPVIIGEYGVSTVKGTGVRKEGEDLFFKNVCEYSLDNGICPVLWDIGFVYKRSTASITDEKEAADYLALAAKAESMNVFVPDGSDGGCTWTGTLSVEGEGWNFSAVPSGLNNTLFLSSVGGCYKLTGVDWSKYSAPKLEIKASGFSANVTIGLGTTLDESNSYWCFIPDDQIKKTETILPSRGDTIDLSSLNLSGMQTLYLVMVQGNSFWPRQDFSGEFTLSITD